MINNIIDLFKEVNIIKGVLDTLYMTIAAAFFAYLIGMPIGVFTVLTDSDGVLKNKVVNKILNIIVNIGRSIPFIILILILIPVTKFIVGKSWGVTASIVPLSIAASFFVARLVEESLREIDKTTIEASICLGMPLFKLIFKVYIKEMLPSLVRGMAITIVNLIGYTAMAGAIGGGGLGDIAYRYGFVKYRSDVMFVTIIIIIIIVYLFQLMFNIFAKKIDKK